MKALEIRYVSGSQVTEPDCSHYSTPTDIGKSQTIEFCLFWRYVLEKCGKALHETCSVIAHAALFLCFGEERSHELMSHGRNL